MASKFDHMTEFELLCLTDGEGLHEGGHLYGPASTSDLLHCIFHLQAAEKVDAASDESWLGRDPQLFGAADTGAIVRR